MTLQHSIAAVLIGRNEGARLERALAAVQGRVGRIVYVDSGSTDQSVAASNAAGAEVVELDPALPFTAARARNAGIAHLRQGPRPVPDYVQMIDADCELQPGWLAQAHDFLDRNPTVAVACGRRRERCLRTSVYNRLCDAEWNTPPGLALACGGDAFFRMAALRAVGGYDPRLIAGEEPELCLRLRGAGWLVWRLDAEMTQHDAAMIHFGQWWTRARRAGYAYAQGAALHGRTPERHWVAETRRALLWGAGLPAATLLLAHFAGPGALVLLLAYPAQAVRLALRGGGGRDAWERALFLVLGKWPEALGVFDFTVRRIRRHPAGLIEYK